MAGCRPWPDRTRRRIFTVIRGLPARLCSGSWTGFPNTTSGVLVNVVFWTLGATVVTALAAAAIVVGAVAYGLAAWRGWRWRPLALAGLVAAGIVIAVTGGPAGAFDGHTVAFRELTADRAPGQSPGAVAAGRWPAWLAAQLPLSVGTGLVAGGLARHQVTHLPAHELSFGAQRRRRRHADQAQPRRCAPRWGRRSPPAMAPRPRGVDRGDLDAWHTGWWATIPDAVLGLGTVLVGHATKTAVTRVATTADPATPVTATLERPEPPRAVPGPAAPTPAELPEVDNDDEPWVPQ
jgi:hypothetical protein